MQEIQTFEKFNLPDSLTESAFLFARCLHEEQVNKGKDSRKAAYEVCEALAKCFLDGKIERKTGDLI